MKKRGRPPIEGETKQTKTLTIKPSLWKEATKKAKRLQVSVSQYLVDLIEKDLKK